MFPQLNPIKRTEQITDSFRGYHHRSKVPDGMWYDMKNLSADEYPVLATRAPRGVIGSVSAPRGMIAKDAIAYIDGTTLYYNGNAVTLPSGVGLSAAASMLPKRIVGMGAYIIVFPDCVYYNTVDSTDAGYLFASFDAPEQGTVTFSPCRMDGEIYSGVTSSATAPVSPDNGELWLDTGADTHVLRQWSSQQQEWVSIPTVYTRIGCTNIGKTFAQWDGVEISGVTYGGANSAVATQAAALNGSHVIYARGDDYIVLAGMLDAQFTQTGGLGVERAVPKMDYVVESGNRLWGCRYGLQNGSVVNEIYACKLGDPKNWNCFLGISTDSYRVSLGSDGQFTGAITYQGYPTIFKENCIHRVYGTEPSSYQVITQEFRGVQKGSGSSLAIVGQTLYYKSRTDVCAYDGSAPISISDSLGDEPYFEAVAGAWKNKYVISMKDKGNAWSLFVYDAVNGIWTREDATRLVATAAVDEELYCLTPDKLICLGGKDGTKESAVPWMCESGIMIYDHGRYSRANPNHKHLSRFNIRCQLANYSSMSVYFEYDSQGGWVHAGTIHGTGLARTVHMYVVPRRCDHLRMKIEGTNTAKIFSIARLLEEASDL